MNQDNLPQPVKQQQGGRKLFSLPKTEIVQNQIFSQPKGSLDPYDQQNHQSMYNRSLQTDDIQGAKPGTLTSIAVKNLQKAQQISQINQIQEQQLRAYQEHQDQKQGTYENNYPQKQYPTNQNTYDQYNYSAAPGLENSQQQQPEQQYYQNLAPIDEGMQQKVEEEKQFLQNCENYYRGMTPSVHSRKEYNKIQDNLIKAKEQSLKKVDQQIRHDEQIYSSDQFINDIATFYDGEKLIKQQAQKQQLAQQQKYPSTQPNYQELSNIKPVQYEQKYPQVQQNYQEPQYSKPAQYEPKPAQYLPSNQQSELDDLQQKIKILEQQLSTNNSQIQQKQEMPKPYGTQSQDQVYGYPPMQRYNPTSLSFAGKNDLIQNSLQATTGNQIIHDQLSTNQQLQSYQNPGNQKNIHRFGGGLKNMGFM